MHQNELELEKYFTEKLITLGWTEIKANALPRAGNDEPLLEFELSDRIKKINANNDITDEDIKRVITELKLVPTGIEGSKKLLKYLRSGVPIKYETDGVVKQTRLFDYEKLSNNSFYVCRQVVNSGASRIKNDIILYINGIPLVNIELKDPTNPAESWVNAYNQIIDYFSIVPELYKYIQIGLASNGNARYFPIVPWANEIKTYEWKSEGKGSIDSAIEMLKPETLLDLIKNFLFVRVEQGEVTKVIGRYMQVRAVNKISDRITNYFSGKDTKDKGLIWHWQGSGKTFEMISAANKMQYMDILENPTQFLIIDRDDLQTQLSGEFNALDGFKPIVIDRIDTLKAVIKTDDYKGKRGIFIVLMHKFRPGEFNDIISTLKNSTGDTISTRKNVICYIDESHRSQYGLLASQLKEILKSAFYFAFTGTPVARKGKNTYKEFSYPPDELYLDKYFITESIEDGYTKRITHKQRLDELHLDKEKLTAFMEAQYEEIPTEYREDVKDEVRKKLNTVNVFLEDPKRIEAIAKDISEHFKAEVEPNFKAMIVTASRLACVRYKNAIDKYLPSSYSEIVMTYDPTKDVSEKEIYDYYTGLKKRFHTQEFDTINEAIVTNYKEEKEPKILIVTDMLLTGFDAPILQTMYLDKPLKEQRLLQAIARTNRPYKEKESGLIIDYVGIFERIEKAFEMYAGEDLAGALYDDEMLVSEFEKFMKELFEMFSGIPQNYTIPILQKTLEVITKDKESEEKFTSKYRAMRSLYELLGSDVVILDNLEKYKWLTAVYTNYIKRVIRDDKFKEYVEKHFRKTVELIHQQTEVQEILESPITNVIDEKFIEKINENAEDKGSQTSNLVFALNKFVLVDKHKNPIYESLIERVEALVKKWRERINANSDVDQIYNDAMVISGEIAQIQKEKNELGLTDVQMTIWLNIKSALNIGSELNILAELKTLFDELEEYLIPGWEKNTELKKSIETKTRQFLFLKIKNQFNLTLDQLNTLHKKIMDIMIGYEN